MLRTKRQEQPLEVFCKKKVFLEISQNAKENTCDRVSFFNKVAGLAWIHFWRQISDFYLTNVMEFVELLNLHMDLISTIHP